MPHIIENSPPKGGFINQSQHTFSDISSEKEREYNFPNGNKLLIINPLYLNVSKSGGHRLFCEDGHCYYIQPKEGWWIRWKVKENNAHFVK